MEITHNSGDTVNTDKLSDVDALLMEESKKLYDLFHKYNRQLLLLGEMKSSEITTKEQGCSFFHVMPKTATPDEINKGFHMYFWRLDGFLRMISQGKMFIARPPAPGELEQQS